MKQENLKTLKLIFSKNSRYGRGIFTGKYFLKIKKKNYKETFKIFQILLK